MSEFRKRPLLETATELDPLKRAMLQRASVVEFRQGQHVPSQSYARSNFSNPISESDTPLQPLHRTQHDIEESIKECGEDPNDTYFDDFRPENNFGDKFANYIRPKQLMEPIQASTALMWQHMKSLPQIEAEHPKQLPDVSGEFHIHFKLPRVRNIELNPRFAGKSFNVKWGSNSVALAVYLTGDEAERPCKKCARRSGPFMGCVLPAKSVLRNVSSISCANCRYNWQGKQCEWYVNNKDPPLNKTSHPQDIEAQGAGDDSSLIRQHLNPSSTESQKCVPGRDFTIVHYNQTRDHWPHQVPVQKTSAGTLVPEEVDSERIIEHHAVEHNITDVIDRFFQSLPKLQESVKKVDRLASSQAKDYSIRIKHEYETESNTHQDSPENEVNPVPESHIVPKVVVRVSDWEVAPGIYRGQHCNERIAYSAAYLENTSSLIPVHSGVGARLEKIVPSGVGHVLPCNHIVQICFVHGGTAEVMIGMDRVIVSSGGMFKILEGHGALIRNLGQVDITVSVVAVDA